MKYSDLKSGDIIYIAANSKDEIVIQINEIDETGISAIKGGWFPKIAINKIHFISRTPVDLTPENELGVANVWHEGSKSFYRATLLEKLTPDQAMAHW